MWSVDEHVDLRKSFTFYKITQEISNNKDSVLK